MNMLLDINNRQPLTFVFGKDFEVEGVTVRKVTQTNKRIWLDITTTVTNAEQLAMSLVTMVRDFLVMKQRDLEGQLVNYGAYLWSFSVNPTKNGNLNFSIGFYPQT